MPTQRLGTGIELYYETHGQGEPIVLIPSTAYGANVWETYQVPALSKELRVITFDPRGCGRSSAPPGVYTMEQMACDVAALLEHLGVRSAHILGHSMGGRIGLALALAYPGRVRSLILAASGSGPAIRSGEECIPGLPFRLVDELVALGFEEFIRHEIVETTTFFTNDYLNKHAETVRAFYDVAWKQHARWPAYLRLIMARHTWEGTHRLGEISMPTLIMIGGADDIGSNHISQSQALADRIPGAEKVILKGQSHGFFWQAPDQTNALILDWVKRHHGEVDAAA